MKKLLTLIFLITLFQNLIAQPANDDCDGLIDLGVAPVCPTDIYTNVDATESDIGNDNFPDCFNGLQRDVWFAFTTDNTITDYTITVTGITDGLGSTPMLNPQIELYRGDCSFDNLASLEVCVSAPDGAGSVITNVFGLDPNEIYFIRVNDYSSTATPNEGSFQFCIVEYIPDVNICDVTESESCTGTLYDCGGPDGDYENNENYSFTICPSEFHQCIQIDMQDYDIEPNFFGFGDQLNFYAGEDNTAPLISSVSGVSNGNPFQIQTSSNCITIEFISDGFTTGAGFELDWQCFAFPCTASSPDNPTVVGAIPYNNTDLSTCDDASTIAESPCPDDGFLNGPDYVFTYDSPGDQCISVQLFGAETGTGIVVLSGPPSDPNTICIAQNEGGFIPSANLEEAGTYYIIVANQQTCTDFDIEIMEAECALSPSLVSALCNPLNGCQQFDDDGNELPSIFVLEQGFQDVPNTVGTNNGCWFGVGGGNYYWFTIQAQANGDFGFVVEGANFPSDIDFNVWGPFTEEQVCEMPNSVIDFITNNQPVRSSYAGGADPTGLTDINPVNGTVVTDEYDCDGNNDDFVTPIPVTVDEVYVVLMNDWGDQIQDGIIEVDWSASDPGVLDPIPVEIEAGDTTICAGDTAQLSIVTGVDNITWLNDTNTLSCDDCPNPLAFPDVTTTYQVAVNGVCVDDTLDITVSVFDVNAGPDVTVCLGEDIQIVAGSNFPNATYEWTATDLSNFSCTDCPDPIITGTTAGTFTYSVTLNGPGCTITDEMEFTVLTDPAPIFGVVADTVLLCEGESTELGIATNNPNYVYTWVSDPVGFVSSLPNPSTTPTESTMYYVFVSGGSVTTCPTSSLDSVYVDVAQLPIIDVIEDTLVCQGQSVTLGNTIEENGVVYSWSPTTGMADGDDTLANPTVLIETEETYILTASRGGCETMDTVTISSTLIDVEILNPDSLIICRGETVEINAVASPPSLGIFWTPDDGSISPTTGTQTIAEPGIVTTYFATVSVPGCTVMDSIFIDVDSIPLDMSIMPADTMVCEGALVVLESPIFEQSDFPDIDFQWSPGLGQISPDSLYNMVISAQETLTYIRTTTNGVCTQMDSATINVAPTTEIIITPSDPIICEGESIDLTASSADVSEFTWTPGDIMDPTITVTPDQTTTYMVEGEFMGCPVMAAVTVEVSPDAATGLIPDSEICEGESIILNTTLDPNPNTTYTWTASPDDPSLVVTDPQPNVSPTVTTTYTVLIDNGVCDPFEGEVTVTVNTAPELSVSDDATICRGDEITLTATTSPGGTVTWSPGGSNQPSITVAPVSNEVYTATYTNGCGTLSESVTITVNDSNVSDIPEDYNICLGESAILNTVPSTGSTYTWTASPDDPTLDSDAALPEVSPTETTTYNVTITNGICPDIEEEITIYVLEDPVLSIVPVDPAICSGDSIELTASIDQDGNDNFEWMPTDETGPTIEVDPDDTTSYTVTYDTGCGIISETVEVAVLPGFMVDISYSPDTLTQQEIPEGEVITLTGNLSSPQPGATFEWSTGQTGQSITINADMTESYSVTVTNASGCTAEDIITFTVVPATLEMPNAFTPDGDDINDFFRPVTTGRATIESFRIYNRWGNLVYDNDDPDQGWDGTKDGTELPSDVYIYILQAVTPSGREFNEKGDVTLIR